MRLYAIILLIIVSFGTLFSQQEYLYKGPNLINFSYTVNTDNTLTLTLVSGHPYALIIPAKIENRTVTKIASNIFSDPKIKKYDVVIIYIPATVTSIEKDSFNGVELGTVVIYSGDTAGFDLSVFDDYPSIDAIKFTKENSPDFRESPRVGYFGNILDHREYVVHDNVLTKYRGKILFHRGSYSIVGQYIPDQIRMADSEVTIPTELYGKTITIIAKEAFKREGQQYSTSDYKDITAKLRDNPYPLKKVIIPYGITSIGDYAFADNKSLAEVVIPSSVTEIGEGIFTGVEALKVVTDENGNLCGDENFIAIKNKIYKYIGNSEDVVIPSEINGYTITEMDEKIFFRSNVKSVTMPDTVEKIGKWCFAENKSLTAVILSKRLAALPESSFSNCTALQDIVIPDSVTAIGINAFNRCSAITKIVLNSTITSIDLNYNMFWQNSKVVILTQEGSIADEYAKKYNLSVEYID